LCDREKGTGKGSPSLNQTVEVASLCCIGGLAFWKLNAGKFRMDIVVNDLKPQERRLIMKCKPVQWMCILVLIVIFAGCASTTKTNVDSQVVVQESLQQFLDQQEILETLYQYTYNFDGKKPDQFAELFTENAVWEIFPRGAKKPRFSFANRSELKDFVSNRFKTVLAERQTQHYLTNTVFLELKNNFARTQSTVLVVHKIKGEKQPKVINSAIYKDEFIKTKDGWKFSRHRAM